jgi:hypothetical protein
MEQEYIMAKAKKILVAGLCAATLGGGFLAMATPADAQYHRGYSRGHHPGYAYRHHRRSHRGGALAAGVVGGLALGALAAGAARPAYAAPVYGADCYVVRRRFVDDWGRSFVRRERVCE